MYHICIEIYFIVRILFLFQLFGPKWHYNMPKYAANLSAAPLQPQKQIQQSNSINTDSSEKTNKEPTTWVDPFTQDGQECK